MILRQLTFSLSESTTTPQNIHLSADNFQIHVFYSFVGTISHTIPIVSWTLSLQYYTIILTWFIWTSSFCRPSGSFFFLLLRSKLWQPFLPFFQPYSVLIKSWLFSHLVFKLRTTCTQCMLRNRKHMRANSVFLTLPYTQYPPARASSSPISSSPNTAGRFKNSTDWFMTDSLMLIG